MTKIQQDTQSGAAACRKRVQDDIRKLNTKANSAKRNILEITRLESLQTIKANFRLIFGPLQETEYLSKSAKYTKVTNLDRINTIRSLSKSHPHSMVALSLTHPTKVWTESSTDVFDSLIKSIKDKTEQDWPDEIVDVMNELEKERLISVEFGNLRSMINCLCFLSILIDW